MKIGIVKEPSVFLYEKPGKSPVDQLFMGWAVSILGEKDEYYQTVTHYGYSGYLKKENVRITLEEKVQQRDKCKNAWVVSASFADVLLEPKVQGERLITLEKGSFVECMEISDRDREQYNEEHGFVKVCMASGVEGYMPGIALTRRLDNDRYLYSARRRNYFYEQGNACGKGNFSEQEFRDKVSAYAWSYLGTPYRWAGKSGEGIDCSGLVFMCYLFCGCLIYRDAKIHPGYPIKSISFEKMKKGDLLYFPGHVAMYIGEGRYIHATGNKNSFSCVINSLWEGDSMYRKDLRKSLYAVGSIF